LSKSGDEIILETYPHLVTFFRILAGPFILWCLSKRYIELSLVVFVIAGFSDWLDGYIARRLRVESSFGVLFDPIADKIFVSCLFFYTMHISLVFMMLGVLVIFRDVFILLGGALLKIKNRDLDLKPIYISKINTAFLLIHILSVLAADACFENFSHGFFPSFYNSFFSNLIHAFQPHLLWADLKLLAQVVVGEEAVGMKMMRCVIQYTILVSTISALVTTLLSGGFYVRIFTKVYSKS
jgi:cardiolipin synthase